MFKVLFISHDANRAGAQLLLLNILKWLKTNHSNISFSILLANNGPLENEFNSISKVYHWNINAKNIFPFFLKKLYNYLHRIILLKKIKSEKFDIIYSNTILNGYLCNILKENINAPVITHVHELEYWITKAGTDNLNYVKKNTDIYIAASNAVKNNLLKYNIDEVKIKVIYEYIDVQELSNKENYKSVKQLLGLSNDCLIVGACGAENFRKGKDWFIPIASIVLEKFKDKEVHFIWIGGQLNNEVIFDLERCGYKNQIHFINHLPNAYQYFNEFDVFLMISREDPFPTVNLEFGLFKSPIICFENAGGTVELIEENCGIKVPYANLEKMSDAIIKLLMDDELRNKFGVNLSEKIKSKFDINIIGEEIVEIIQKLKIN